jgi:hypothetical protein
MTIAVERDSTKHGAGRPRASASSRCGVTKQPSTLPYRSPVVVETARKEDDPQPS